MDFRGKNIDLVGKQNLWFGISLALILVGMISWAIFGLNLGIDFKGGGQYSYAIPEAKLPKAGAEVALIEQARTALDKQGLDKVRLQVAGGQTLVISTDALPSQLGTQGQRVGTALKEVFGEEPKLIGQQSVGPVIGEELRRNAINGVVLGVLLIALWIYIRYNFAGEGLRYAVAGIAALVHDVLVLVGLFALIGHIDPRIEIDSSFIAALLTVVGYSINDSVVIFDRIRENLKLRRKEPYAQVVNTSLLETMSRSINTGLTVLIMLFVLLLFGGASMYNFVLAMLVGIASGLYSSIFNASMVLVAWHKHDEKKAAEARAARASKVATRTTPVAATRPSTSRTLTSSGTRPVLSSGAATSSASVHPAATPTGTMTELGPEDAPSESSAETNPAPQPTSSPLDSSRVYSGPRKARAKRRF